MKFLSLFSGIGGLDLGLERAGMTCIGQVEWNDYAVKVLEKHWPDVPRHRDITKFCRRCYDCEPETEDGEVKCPRCDTDFSECECLGTDQFLDEWGWPSIICGGDPCQDNSNACRAADATRPSCGIEFIRVVDEIRPRLVLRENPAVIRSDAPWTWQRFRSELERLDYTVLSFRLRACCVGLDHRRDRMFLLATLPNANGKGLEGYERKVLAGAEAWRHDSNPARPDRRNPTPRICRGVDGIPHRVDRLKCLGNAVVPVVAEVIGRAIMNADESEKNLENTRVSPCIQPKIE